MLTCIINNILYTILYCCQRTIIATSLYPKLYNQLNLFEKLKQLKINSIV